MWRHLRRWLVISLGVLLVLVGGCVVLLGKAFEMCGEETLDQVVSPDGRYIAGVFRRNCGATTGFTHHVNLRRGSEPFPRSMGGTLDDGLVYIAGEESWPIKLRWKDAKHLVIRGPSEDPSLKTHWQDVSIRWEWVVP